MIKPNRWNVVMRIAIDWGPFFSSKQSVITMVFAILFVNAIYTIIAAKIG